MRSFTSFALVAGIFGTLALSSNPAAAQTYKGARQASDEQPWISICRKGGPMEASRLPSVIRRDQCNLVGRLITDGPMGAVVPPPGQSVFAEGLGELEYDLLEITTDLDGTVHLGHIGPELIGHENDLDDPTLLDPTPAPEEERSTTDAAACQDTAYNLLGSKWTMTMNWYYNPAGIPAGITVADSERELKAAVNNMATGYTDCNYPHSFTSASWYPGQTTMKANMVSDTASVACSSSDDKTVVDWGALPSGYWGYTCRFTKVNSSGVRYIFSSDIRLNKGKAWWANTGTCSGGMDLQNLATHEFGHAFGFEHPASGHSYLTMDPSMNSCSTTKRTLGLGDLMGMDAMY